MLLFFKRPKIVLYHILEVRYNNRSPILLTNTLSTFAVTKHQPCSKMSWILLSAVQVMLEWKNRAIIVPKSAGWRLARNSVCVLFYLYTKSLILPLPLSMNSPCGNPPSSSETGIWFRWFKGWPSGTDSDYISLIFFSLKSFILNYPLL